MGEGNVRAFFILSMMLLAAGNGHAVTTQSFQVSATITPGCSVAAGSGGLLGTLDFGTHSGVERGQVNTSFVPNGSLTIACTPGVALSMSIDGGQHYTSVRNMQRAGATNQVPYRLYSSSSLAANSEIGVNQAVSVAYTNSNNIALPLFGVALLTGFSPAGNYSDQLTVTLSW
ncbi:spore coat U domain-containing protein [Leclercia barmai]|uniref:Spore coat protein U domain-containing protein n=2 Tax=Enterobacteriaceae TaxID=543 RepID=A0ABS7RR07_9ENTR|nr:spore coat protein U domain-containing protein [Leclercia sp. EMC7]MCM5698888.1 spore coat U domain-containing protein [Leclercia sp. LTM14]